MRHLRRARMALARHRRNIARALGGPTSVALVSVAIMAFGLAAVFGGGWAAIAVGGVGIVAAVRMASARHR